MEKKTRRTVSIATSPTPENLAKCHPQSQSRLFSLPQELRDLIYALALAPWNDRAQSYGSREYYYRPDHVAKPMVLTDLLLTCRRIWLEANSIAIKQWRPTFWYGRGPAARDWIPGGGIRGAHAKHDRFFSNMTDNMLRNVTNLKLHAQMFRIEPMGDLASGEQRIAAHFDPALLRRGFAPSKMRVTIRHTDWWYWESDDPLRLEDQWVQALLDSPLASCLEVFELELETLERKRDQLQRIVDRLRKLSGAARRVNLLDPNDGRAIRLVCANETPAISHWTGRNDFEHSKPWEQDEGSKTYDYHVAILTWRAISCPMPPPPTSSTFISPTSGLLHINARADINFSAYSPPLDSFDFESFLIREPDRMPKAEYIHWTAAGWMPKDDGLRPGLLLCEASAEAARGIEGTVRKRFEDGMAVLEARRVEERWRGEGSLMELA